MNFNISFVAKIHRALQIVPRKIRGISARVKVAGAEIHGVRSASYRGS
jgi:hypothetical protein